MSALLAWIRRRIGRTERVVGAGDVAFLLDAGERWRTVTRDERPDLFAELGEVCRGCGCSDAIACAGGCWWVARGLCSRCIGAYGGTD